MARISTYPKDLEVSDYDAWIGTNHPTGATKQFTAKAVADYLNIKGKISVSAQMVFKYWTNNPLNAQAPGPGDFYGPAAGSAITSITTIQVYKQDVSGQDVVAFMDYIVGSNILISEQNNISTFGDFLIDSYAINDPDDDFYTLNLTSVGGSGNLTELLHFDFALKEGDYVTGVNAGEYINIDNPSGAVPTINHNITSRVDTSSADSALTFPVIDTITTNNTGHVTSVNTKTVTVPVSIDGSGTTNFVTKWIDTDTIGDSLMFDNGTSVGIGVANPSNLLQIGSVGSTGFTNQKIAWGDGTYAGALNVSSSGSTLYASGDQIFSPGTIERMRITSAGGISFGSTGTAYGTSGQILKSNANASPTWVDASTVIGGPYLPLSGGTMTGQITATPGIEMGAGNINFADSGKVRLGDSSDLQIYNNGTHSYIINTTGDLTIDSQGDDLLLKAADDLLLYVQGTEVALQAIGNAGVKIRYNNVVKFETTSTGVSVTGSAGI